MDRSWHDVLVLCREARRHRDLEVRSAILDDLIEGIYEVGKDKGGALESAFQDDLSPQDRRLSAAGRDPVEVALLGQGV